MEDDKGDFGAHWISGAPAILTFLSPSTVILRCERSEPRRAEEDSAVGRVSARAPPLQIIGWRGFTFGLGRDRMMMLPIATSAMPMKERAVH